MKDGISDTTYGKIRRVTAFNLAENTTYGLGGQCDEAFFPKTFEETEFIFEKLVSENKQFFVLGKGSDILAADGKINKSIICTSDLCGIERLGDDIIFCNSGTHINKILSYCEEEGLTGIEYLAGIPASIGGIAYMNGGAAGKHICDNVLSVDIYDGKRRVLSNKCCKFGNKHSTMRDINCIIEGVTLQLQRSEPIKIRVNIKNYLFARRNQPKGKSCGCVFKNPQGLSAGKLIDDCNLKGFSLGGAKVSEKHANFIINNGASSDEVYSLIQYIKSEVLRKTGILLEEEVVYIGEFNEINC